MTINGIDPRWGDPQEALQSVVDRAQVSRDRLETVVVNGGPAIRVRTDRGGSEVFVHNTYRAAADEAVAFLLQKPLAPHKNTKLNRQARRRFDAALRKPKREMS